MGRGLGLSFLQRMRLRLWIHFLPHRIVCLIVGHNDEDEDEPGTAITTGPLGAPPAERDYHLLGAHVQCKRCARMREVDYTPEQETAWIAAARAEDEEEWADPEYQALIREADRRVQEWQGGEPGSALD